MNRSRSGRSGQVLVESAWCLMLLAVFLVGILLVGDYSLAVKRTHESSRYILWKDFCQVGSLDTTIVEPKFFAAYGLTKPKATTGERSRVTFAQVKEIEFEEVMRELPDDVPGAAEAKALIASGMHSLRSQVDFHVVPYWDLPLPEGALSTTISSSQMTEGRSELMIFPPLVINADPGPPSDNPPDDPTNW